MSRRATAGPSTADRGAHVAVAALVLLGVLLRARYVTSPGFPTDVQTFMAWAERMVEVGPGRFYAPGYFSDYPPGFLYVLWLLGAAFDGELLRLAVKAISIPFDVAIALLAARVAWRAAGRAFGVVAAAAWMLSPGAIFAGAHWGQVDAVGTLPMFGAALAAGRGRWLLAGALGGVAAILKPQFGLALIVVLAAAAAVFIREGRAGPVLRALGAAAAAIFLPSLPFGYGPVELVTLVRTAADTYPYTSLYAFNPWSVVADFWKPDDGLTLIGGALLVLGVGASCVPLWWRRDTAALLACTAAAVLAFYFLPTRAHERYIFPALALLLPLAVVRARLLAPYALLQAAFPVTLAIVFSAYGLLDAPALVRATLFSRTGEIALALAMTAAAAVVAWRLARGEARLEPTLAIATGAVPSLRRWSLPPGLAPGRAPGRRDVALAALVALAVLATRGYRLDQPRDMYFDEIYHARTAAELLAQREPFEWTHPPLGKEIMALGILAFSEDRVVGTAPVAPGAVALAIANDGTRVFAMPDGSVEVRDRRGAEIARAPVAAEPIRAIALDAARLYVVTDRELFELDLRSSRAPPSASALRVTGAVTSLAASAGRVAIATDRAIELRGGGQPVVVRTPAVALTLKPDATVLFALDPDGTVRLIDPNDGRELRSFAGAPGTAIAYALSPDRVIVAARDAAAIEVVSLEEGKRDRVALSNARTGTVRSAPTALALVPRAQMLYALADGHLIVIEPHGASAFASIPVRGSLLGVDGTADELVVAGTEGGERVPTGRHALAWRIPGLLAGALFAFLLVLLARRLFASAIAPALVGAALLLDGSTFAQARIGIVDIYVAAFLVGAWYFVVAAHAPRRSARLDVLIAGVLFGLAAATKWVAFYSIAALALGALVVTARAYAQGRAGRGGPLDLFAGRGLNAVYLVACFGAVPIALYLASYLPWFGGPTIPYTWDLAELTKQMYWYHSGLTTPHPSGSPWWSWPFVLKPVYWYYGASEGGGSAVIYDAGNVALYWSAFAATAWCAVAAIRARAANLAFVLFALAAQVIPWLAITRVLFFYHFFTALPFYLLALAAALVALWETGRRPIVALVLASALGAFTYFYPFVSGQPVPADQTAMFFILPTWQYDCQFYPAFTCDLEVRPVVEPGVAAARLLLPLAVVALAAVAWAVVYRPAVMELAMRPLRSRRARR